MRQMLLGAVPNDGVVGVEMGVGQDIPEARDRPPGHLRRLGRQFSRQLLDGFPDDFKAPSNRIDA